MSAPSFRFPLDKVLELRQEKERDRAVELARARREARGAQEMREDLLERRGQERDRLGRAHRDGGPVGVLRSFGLLAERLDEQLRQAEEACRQADAEVTRTLRDFHEAAVDRQTLDRLRARRKEEWATQRIRDEQQALDEVALTRHVRGQGEAGEVDR